jgi:hypothetical protein
VRNIFKRRRPEPAPVKYSHADIITAYLNGLTLDAWDALPALVKKDLRESVAHAQRFGVSK